MRPQELGNDLSSILKSQDYTAFVSNLRGQDLTDFINFLDKALDSESTQEDREVHRKGLRSLRKICGVVSRLPTSHFITHEIFNKDDIPTASGGSADVYIAEYQSRKVAIKKFRLYQSDDLDMIQKTFCQEVVIWKRMAHPNVLPLLGVSKTLKPLYMVSEWMDNGNINQYLKQKPKADRLQLLLGIAQGLEYLHYYSVIHGDLKGANVVIDARGNALLADFGLSSIMTGPLSIISTPSRKGGGTARWMAPELLNPTMADQDMTPHNPASDAYAFAMVAIEVFTGDIPFAQIRNTQKVTQMVLKGGRPDRPKDAESLGLTGEVWDIIQTCWQKNPDSRFGAFKLVECLTKALAVFSQTHGHLVVRDSPTLQNGVSSSLPKSSNTTPVGLTTNGTRQPRPKDVVGSLPKAPEIAVSAQLSPPNERSEPETHETSVVSETAEPTAHRNGLTGIAAGQERLTSWQDIDAPLHSEIPYSKSEAGHTPLSNGSTSPSQVPSISPKAETEQKAPEIAAPAQLSPPNKGSEPETQDPSVVSEIAEPAARRNGITAGQERLTSWQDIDEPEIPYSKPEAGHTLPSNGPTSPSPVASTPPEAETEAEPPASESASPARTATPPRDSLISSLSQINGPNEGSWFVVPSRTVGVAAKPPILEPITAANSTSSLAGPATPQNPDDTALEPIATPPQASIEDLALKISEVPQGSDLAPSIRPSREEMKSEDPELKPAPVDHPSATVNSSEKPIAPRPTSPQPPKSRPSSKFSEKIVAPAIDPDPSIHDKKAGCCSGCTIQ